MNMNQSEDRFLKRVGANYRALRVQQGLTIPQVAEATGLSRGVISHFENGVSDVQITTLCKMAAALSPLLDKVSLNDIRALLPTPRIMRQGSCVNRALMRRCES